MIALLYAAPFLNAKLFEHNPLALLTVTGSGRLLKANLQAKELLSTGADGMFCPAILENSLLRQRLDAGQPFRELNISVYQSGRRREFLVEGSLIKSLFRSIFLLSLQDTTAANRNLRKLRYRASRDSLTGLLNRGAFLGKLDCSIVQADKQDEILMVMYIDINDFKEINSAHGHEAGDTVLTGVSRLIARIVGRKGVVGRLGGDELAVFMNPAPSYPAFGDTVVQLAEAIRSMDIPYKGQIIKTGASYGASLSIGAGENAAAILSRADKAMYRMKDGPRFD
ncbi:MAG: putative signal transduction protein containing a rane domain, an and a domain [Paenibacillaceae bacterium]|nr:putative signal transduction protein containing a rane domain, an and a domain [Paenibacillaceae bacterium]